MPSLVLITLCVVIGVFLSLTHSLRTKGPYLTGNFFLFLVFLILANGARPQASVFQGALPGKEVMFPLLGAGLAVSIFYVSWHTAELILMRTRQIRSEIAPLVFLGGAVIFSITYSLGFQPSAGTAARILMGYPFCSAWEWCVCFINFLTAFLLINRSTYKHAEWKAVFFLIPLIQVWLMRFMVNPIPAFTEAFLFTALLLVSMTVRPVYAEMVQADQTVRLEQAKVSHVTPALYIGIWAMVMTVLVLCSQNKAEVVYSIPLLLFLSLTFRAIPLWAVSILSGILLFVFSRLCGFIAAPCICVCFLFLLDRIRKTRSGI